MAELPPREHIIRDILYAGCVTVMYSKPGVGKTFLALDMAFAVAAGIPWRGLETLKSPSLFVAGEGMAGMPDRARALIEGPVKAWRIAQDIPAGVALGMFFFPGSVQIADFVSREAFKNELREVTEDAGAPIRLVIFDTMAACNSGKEENSVKDMTPFFDAIRSTLPNAATMILHHTGKAGLGLRGSSAIEGAADVVLKLARTDQGTLVLIGEKLRDSKFRTRYFSLREIPLPNGESSCVIDDAAEIPTTENAQVLELLKSLLAFPEGLTQAEVREKYNTARATLYRAKEEALEKKFITVYGDEGRMVLTACGAAVITGEGT